MPRLGPCDEHFMFMPIWEFARHGNPSPWIPCERQFAWLPDGGGVAFFLGLPFQIIWDQIANPHVSARFLIGLSCC